MSETLNNESMNVKLSVNDQMVYVFYEAPDYYLVSLFADGTKKFKADKMKLSK
jgi:hypothetical protein